MRTIKFRAWDKERRRMWSVEGLSYNAPDKSLSHICVTSPHLQLFLTADEAELMQFTGLKDKNGKEIFEGDIVDYLDNTSKGLVKKQVTIEDITHLPDFTCSKWEEVIGNIYENPELVTHETA